MYSGAVVGSHSGITLFEIIFIKHQMTLLEVLEKKKAYLDGDITTVKSIVSCTLFQIL